MSTPCLDQMASEGVLFTPHGPRRVVVDDCLWSPDFMPTCCQLLNEDLPTGTHGRVSCDLVTGSEAQGWEYMVSGWRKKEYYYVVDDEWRFVSSGEAGPRGLYNIAEDPGEPQDGASDHPEVCRMMKERLERYFRDAESLKP